MNIEQKEAIQRLYYHVRDLYKVSDKHSHAKSYYEGMVDGIESTLRRLEIDKDDLFEEYVD